MPAGATSSAVEAGLAEPPQSASVVTQPVASQPASQAASQGVFDTMMAASKQKSKGPAASASGPTASTSSCGRSHEQALLARVFASQAAAVLPPAVLSSLCVQRIAEGSSQARCVSPTRSLWVCAGRSDPPACRLQDRVKKRKTEAAVQAEVLKKQHVEQQTQQYGVPEQSSASSLADVQHTAFCEPCSLYTQDRVGKSGCSAEATERTVLASVQDDVHDKANQGTCMLSQQPAQPVLQQASTRTVEPMKRMRLQALQQELTAARQTVADLERMIKVESLS